MMMAMLTMLMIKKYLFRQSKINYTVLKDSPYMEYFKVASLYLCHWILIMIMMIMVMIFMIVMYGIRDACSTADIFNHFCLYCPIASTFTHFHPHSSILSACTVSRSNIALIHIKINLQDRLFI